MQQYLHHLRLFISTFTLLGVCAHAAPGQADLSFNFANSHNFLGFGAQVWLNNKNPSASVALLRDINARYVRVSLTPQIKPSQLDPRNSVERFSEILAENDSAEQQERFTAFRDQMRPLNIEPVLIFWRMPEQWVETSAARTGGKNKASFAKPENIEGYVNLVVAQMLYIKRLGISPVAVELTNEPHGAWSTKYTREDYATLVQKARATMNKHGLLDVRIAGPGVNLRGFDHYMGGLRDINATSAIGFASAHVYASPKQLADGTIDGIDSFVGRGKFGPVMITEFNVKGNYDDEEQPSTKAADPSTSAFGLAAGADAILLMGLGANSLIYWQLQDFSWQRKSHGMMNEAGARRPVAQVMQVLFSQIPRDSKAVGVRSGIDGLYATAVQSGAKTYLLVANTGDENQRINARFEGGTGCILKSERIDAYRAGADASTVIREVKVSKCQVQGVVAPKSVATITLSK